MKQHLSPARIVGMFAIVALVSAGCAPLPVTLPAILTPTSAVFLPGVAAAPGVGTSPLQPTAVMTGATPSEPTPLPTSTPWAPTAVPAPTLVGPAWQWVSSTFKDGTMLAAGDPARYTFQLLDDGNATVQADCNFGTATYEESGDGISFGAIGTTKMACPPDSLDSAFLAQLKNAATFTLMGDEAVISLKDGAGTMRLQPAPGEAAAATATPIAPASSSTPLPTDTPWPATDVPPTPLPTPTAPPPASPTPLPPGPTSTPVVPTPVLIGTMVPLPTAVIAAATVPPALDGSSWIMTNLIANGQAIPPVGQTPVTLEIDAKGARVSGSTGCNLYRATLSSDANGVIIEAPALMTQKACPANLLVQEVEFIDSLLRARSYVMNGNDLTLMDTAGKTLLVLARK